VGLRIIMDGGQNICFCCKDREGQRAHSKVDTAFRIFHIRSDDAPDMMPYADSKKADYIRRYASA